MKPVSRPTPYWVAARGDRLVAAETVSVVYWNCRQKAMHSAIVRSVRKPKTLNIVGKGKERWERFVYSRMLIRPRPRDGLDLIYNQAKMTSSDCSVNNTILYRSAPTYSSSSPTQQYNRA